MTDKDKHPYPPVGLPTIYASDDPRVLPDYQHQLNTLLRCCGGSRGSHRPDCGDTPYAEMWVTPDDVIRAMGSLPLTVGDRGWLELCVRAANSLIRRFRPDLPLPSVGGAFQTEFDFEYRTEERCIDPMAQYGASQLVIEMYRRRGMVQGENASAFGDFGPPPTSLSYEAQMFLRLGRHQDPVVA